jgi:mRNA-degrading endonuclease toxin of MazEF toxin-antitoxin module
LPPQPERGDIFWASFPTYQSTGSEQRGNRPVLVVSADKINQSGMPICVVVPLSTQVHKANRQFRILIPENQKIPEPGTSGCPGDSVALTEQIRSISTDRLDAQRVAKVKPAATAAVEAGIKYVLRLF